MDLLQQMNLKLTIIIIFKKKNTMNFKGKKKKKNKDSQLRTNILLMNDYFFTYYI